MYTVNPELVALAQAKFEKTSVVPPGGDPAAMGAAPGAMPMDPAAMGAVPPVAPADPASAMAAMAPAPAAPPQAPMPPATPTDVPAAPQGQKLKPEQMMQMLDYRLYNMQQQLTAIMNAMGVQVAPESLVLPPGTTGAPPAETALPGGPMAPPPPQAAPPAAAGGMDPAAAAGGMPPEAMPKVAGWWETDETDSAVSIGRPVDRMQHALHTRAAALQALRRSLLKDEN